MLRPDSVPRSARPRGRALAAVAACAALLAAGPSQAEVGEWAVADHARLRLLSAGPNPDGTMAAAIEIEIDDGWKTYWRSPGDAGLVPLFDFAASSNVISVVVSYPPPTRWDDGYAISNVYEHRVVLPLTIRLADPAVATRLDLAAQIGVCEVVCILAELRAVVNVPPGFTDGRAARTINEARALVPGPPVAGSFEVRSIDRVDGSVEEPVFEIALTVPGENGVEIFVEGPGDWYASLPVEVETGRNRATFRVGFDRLGSVVAIPDATLTVTAVSGDQVIEQTLALR